MHKTKENGKYLFEGDFNLTFTDNVKIKIGGSQQNKTTDEWKSGAKVGKHTIDAATFTKLQEATSDKFTFKISAKPRGTFHDMWVTDLATGKTVKGVFNSKTKEFTFMDAKSQKTTSNSGRMAAGVISGKLVEDFSKINGGRFSIGWIAGKAPVIISADATFFFTGKRAAGKK